MKLTTIKPSLGKYILGTYPLCSYSLGFSLIELLIAVAIVAIIGSIAQPIYSDYVVRANMSEPLQISNNLSNRITQCMTIDNGNYEQCNSFNELNISETDFISNIVESISIDNDTASFTVNLQNTGNRSLNEANLTYRFQHQNALIIRWQCEVSNSELNHLVSKQCRTN